MLENILLDVFKLLLVILIAPFLSRILRIPVLVVEVILGIIIGPSLLNLLRESEWLNVLAIIGFVYLMFIVGLEIELSILKTNLNKIIMISAGSLIAPFTLGYIIALIYNLPPLFIATALSTTSMGIVLPIAKEFSDRKEFSQVLLGSAILVDVISMFILAVVIEEEFLMIEFHKSIISLVVIISLLVTLFTLRKSESLRILLRKFMDVHHVDLRLIFALIFGLAILAEFMGVHAIIGSFFAGLIISLFHSEHEGLVEKKLIEKLLSIGYGLFIPMFFVAVGIRTDIIAIFEKIENLEIMLSLLVAGFLGKFIGTSTISKILGFSSSEAISMGFAMSARLSLIIAAAELGLAAGLIDTELHSILVLLAILSVLISPSLAKITLRR